MYCQRQIEMETPCETQCEHCEQYYRDIDPLTVEDVIKKAAFNYADNHYPNTPDNMEDEVQWYNDMTAFQAGAMYYKNNFNRSEIDLDLDPE